ncbi:S24 family peptidase [Flavobacterium cerinum]|uniref:S24 family peptidase n=1 Tax=Flavobacterium cerinum TaxID=2502784 RepID=A0ABY5ISX7_9FLAO|nr:S24 family peptidase [Flavobacterium cerinum]UUC45895.1 S24 family peptidase [Flavobacterium cerinum]
MKPIQRVKKIIQYYNLSISSFEKRTNMSNNSIQTAIKRTAKLKDETLNNILTAFPNISPEWLLTGNGKMLRKEKIYHTTPTNSITHENAGSYQTTQTNSRDENSKFIPLISDTTLLNIRQIPFITPDHIIEEYHIPNLTNADFLITIKGNSMSPKYNNGDLAACKTIPTDTFLQWNHIYLINTPQGLLIKRIKEGNNQNHVLLVSENSEFQPFQLHKNEINTIAIVIGIIHLL